VPAAVRAIPVRFDRIYLVLESRSPRRGRSARCESCRAAIEHVRILVVGREGVAVGVLPGHHPVTCQHPSSSGRACTAGRPGDKRAPGPACGRMRTTASRACDSSRIVAASLAASATSLQYPCGFPRSEPCLPKYSAGAGHPGSARLRRPEDKSAGVPEPNLLASQSPPGGRSPAAACPRAPLPAAVSSIRNNRTKLMGFIASSFSMPCRINDEPRSPKSGAKLDQNVGGASSGSHCDRKKNRC